MKKIVLTLIIGLAAQCFAKEPWQAGFVSAKSETKAEALASAIRRVPGGAVIYSIGYNGYSVKTSDGKTLSSKYNCIISWKKY